MAPAKTSRIHLFSWCPLGRRDYAITQQQPTEATTDVARTINDERPRQAVYLADTVVADVRQAEPWRRASLRETAARDTDRVDRLSR